MKVEWVNHSSFVIEHAGTRLLSDPWIEGYAFDGSWALISPTRFSYDDFACVTHVWFSHEHPDHFSPPNLKKIPPRIRRHITVLFQPTKDKRVGSFCRDIGFKEVIETPTDWYVLSDELKILCQRVSRGDSWLALKSQQHCVLNLNDCVFLSEQELGAVKEEVGYVDVLVTQFSYASWWGNKEDDHAWQKAADDTLSKIDREINVLDPRFVLLSASFVYFCHRENAYMNNHINTVQTAYRFIEAGRKARPIVLYPGDHWELGESHSSEKALERYSADYKRVLSDPVLVDASKIDTRVLTEAAERFLQTLKRNNTGILLRKLPPALIYLTDHNVSFELSQDGLKPVQCDYDNHDIALSSAALLYCFRFEWGGETLKINGRFQAPINGNNYTFFHWFSIASANSHGTYFDLGYYTRRALAKCRSFLPWWADARRLVRQLNYRYNKAPTQRTK